MPVYDYKCRTCECEFSNEMPMSEYHIIACPKCNTNMNVTRVYSPIGIDFSKGGAGFHRNDYGKN